MRNKRKIVRQVLLLLRNIRKGEAQLSDIELIYRDGEIIGYVLKIESQVKPKLLLVKKAS